jgi:hypothetical protein
VEVTTRVSATPALLDSGKDGNKRHKNDESTADCKELRF